jgi:hypothetical protein
MSHFYGTLTGKAKTTATRCGTKNSGIVTYAASWGGAISVRVYYDERTGTDRYTVTQEPWHGKGVSRVLAEGVIGE